MDWWTDGRDIKSVLRFSSFWCILKIIYICTYICTQTLSPRFLRVSKFDVKLGIVVIIFKITLCTCVLIFDLKVNLKISPVFERNFCEKCSIFIYIWFFCFYSFKEISIIKLKWISPTKGLLYEWVDGWFIFEYAPTMSLRVPAAASSSAEGAS